MKMGVFYEPSRIVAGRFGGIAPRPLRQAEYILAIARYFSLQQSIQQVRRSSPFRYFSFQPNLLLAAWPVVIGGSKRATRLA